LKIGIANFGQMKLPVFSERDPNGLLSLLYGKGLCVKGLAAGADGT
jgi:hypothetical protein